MLFGVIPLMFVVDHADVILSVGVWRLTYLLLPDDQKGHFVRGVRVVRATRVCVSRKQKFLFAIRVYQAEGLVRRAEAEVHEIVHELRESPQERQAENSEMQLFRIELF